MDLESSAREKSISLSEIRCYRRLLNSLATSQCTLAKTILQGKVKGKRRRQNKRWENNIKEQTGVDFTNSAKAAAGRTG